MTSPERSSREYRQVSTGIGIAALFAFGLLQYADKKANQRFEKLVADLNDPERRETALGKITEETGYQALLYRLQELQKAGVDVRGLEALGQGLCSAIKEDLAALPQSTPESRVNSAQEINEKATATGPAVGPR